MRRILVTGANKGIGLAIVRGILEQHDDTSVLLGARDAQRGAAARQSLVAADAAHAERVWVLPLDVASEASVGAAAAQVAARFEGETQPLYGLVNNAGIGLGSGDLAAVVQVNTLGVRRVCEAFLPLLDAAHGRIVNVTSAAGPNFVARCSAERQRFFLDPELDWPALAALIDECLALPDAAAFRARGLGDGSPYGFSKACANTYTLLLAREHPNLAVNACTPGYIDTDMTRPRREASGRSPAEMGLKTPDEGAVCPLHLLFGQLEGSGLYYGSDARRSPLDRYRAPGSPPYTGP
ncbi:MAG: SDR family NAD(P)-dependent oxidoreductase [Myxococcota bacterium]|nr:SDR family NAD(P)-dependent oxidoreductase [Myxococcota bacterium]